MIPMVPTHGAMPAFQETSRHANNVKKHFVVILTMMVAMYVIVTAVRRSYVWIVPSYATFAKIVCVTNAAILPLAPMMFVIIGCVKTAPQLRHANNARVHFVVGLKFLNVRLVLRHFVRIV